MTKIYLYRTIQNNVHCCTFDIFRFLIVSADLVLFDESPGSKYLFKVVYFYLGYKVETVGMRLVKPGVD